MAGRGYVAVTVAALVTGCWRSSSPPPVHAAPPVALDLGAATFDLPSGLRVVTVPDPQATSVFVTVRYQVGGLDDPPGRAGMAHLVEHLTYEASSADHTLFDILTTRALAFNGATTADTTTYFERGDAAQLDELLGVEATRLAQACAQLPDASFARAREIVRNELRERADEDLVSAGLHEVLFPPGHAYRRATGTVETVAAITKEQACAFFAVHYAPRTAVVVVSGNATATAMRAAVERAFGHVERIAIAEPGDVDDAPGGASGTAAVPIPRPAVVIAWPLPADPIARARTRAVAAMAAALVDAEVNGEVSAFELGGDRVRLTALALQPGPGASLDDTIAGAKRGLDEMSQSFGTGLFEQARERAIYELLASYEPGPERDGRLADAVFAGRELATSPTAELRQLGALTREEASVIARTTLAPDAASIAKLTPSGPVRPSAGVALGAPVAEVIDGAVTDDPAAAAIPAALTAQDPLAGAVRRTLPSGMHVVLLPLSTIPIVSIRLVFDAGTVDDPAGQRGVASLAGHALHSHVIDRADMMAFWLAGGALGADVATDHTTFSVDGLAGRLDLLLAGIDRTVRDGDYTSLAETTIQNDMHSQQTTADLAATFAWRTALFGAEHPYVTAGLGHTATGTLGFDQVRAFRDAHYQPDRATLIIAGGFAPAPARAAIDASLGTWTGHGASVRTRAAALQPFALAQTTGGTQVDIHVAIALRDARRATGLVVAEMLAETVAGVRQQLAASYGMHATLVESRLSTTIRIDGRVDANRAADALRLVRDRIAALHAGGADTASLFVTARRRVIARLTAITPTAGALAALAEDEVDLGRGVESERVTAAAVAALTLEQIRPALADVDLQHAAMWLGGPSAAVTAAYAAIGRTGTFMAP